MSFYSIRNAAGVAKFALSNTDAKRLINLIPGSFKETSFVKQGKKVIFNVAKDCSINYGSIRMYFDAGDYFISEEGNF